LSQVSVVLAIEPAQVCAPATQEYVEVLHRMPVPVFWQSDTVPVEQHSAPNQGSLSLLSVVPSQSSSLVLQVSGTGPTVPLQTVCPLVQALVPILQVPWQLLPSRLQPLANG